MTRRTAPYLLISNTFLNVYPPLLPVFILSTVRSALCGCDESLITFPFRVYSERLNVKLVSLWPKYVPSALPYQVFLTKLLIEHKLGVNVQASSHYCYQRLRLYLNPSGSNLHPPYATFMRKNCCRHQGSCDSNSESCDIVASWIVNNSLPAGGLPSSSSGSHRFVRMLLHKYSCLNQLRSCLELETVTINASSWVQGPNLNLEASLLSILYHTP